MPIHWALTGVEATWCATRVDDPERRASHRPDDLVTPASVMKIQIALAASRAIDEGTVDGTARVRLGPDARTPGPVGMSLYHDPVEMSVRDLLVPMMTISDNVATDALIPVVGLETINTLTRGLGLPRTRVTGSLQSMLDGMAREAGFHDYARLSRHDPNADGPPGDTELRALLAGSVALDPSRGSRTTATETARLLSLIWTDAVCPATACATVRALMARQLTHHRIASGFPSTITVAAKSGGLMGIVRNEAAVVVDRDGVAYAVAIFTRQPPDDRTDPASIDAAIGSLAQRLVEELRPY